MERENFDTSELNRPSFKQVEEKQRIAFCKKMPI